MRVYKTLLLLLIVSTSCNAPVDKWQDVRSDKDGFIVKFPGSVKTDTREKEFSETENTTHNSCEARPREGVAYRVDTLYYPLHFVEETEPEQLFQMMIEGGVGAVKGTLEYEKDVVLDDFPGKEYQVGLETSGARIRSRLYISTTGSITCLFGARITTQYGTTTFLGFLSRFGCYRANSEQSRTGS